MEINQLLNEVRQIWGKRKLNLSQIIVRMGKVFGDICKYERNERITDRESGQDALKKELGNMIVPAFVGAMIWVLIRRNALPALSKRKRNTCGKREIRMSNNKKRQHRIFF